VCTVKAQDGQGSAVGDAVEAVGETFSDTSGNGVWYAIQTTSTARAPYTVQPTLTAHTTHIIHPTLTAHTTYLMRREYFLTERNKVCALMQCTEMCFRERLGMSSA